MTKEKSNLQQRIDSGEPILLAEVAPPASGDPASMRTALRGYSQKVHAVGISDNRDQVGISALAAAAIALDEGIEPILHVVTRDRNRIALVSDFLGAQSLGVHNVLCTTGTHQTLGSFRAAKNVFDLDSTQLLWTFKNLAEDASVVGQPSVNGCAPTCLGAVASPNADPIDLQIARLEKKVEAGAQFLITQPIFDFDRFDIWWEKITSRALHKQAAFIVAVQVLTGADEAVDYAGRRPEPMIPQVVLQQLQSQEDKTAERAAGIEIAVESVRRLAKVEGIRGFHLVAAGDDDAVLEVIQQSGLEGQ